MFFCWAGHHPKYNQKFKDRGVSKNRGTPKWMIYNGNPMKMDDLGVPPFKETPIQSAMDK